LKPRKDGDQPMFVTLQGAAFVLSVLSRGTSEGRIRGAPGGKRGLTNVAYAALNSVGVAALCLLIAGTAQATMVRLNDLETTAVFQVDVGEPDGRVSWLVSGVEKIFRRTTCYRIGASGAEQNVSALGSTAYELLDTNGNPGDDTLVVRYTGMGFEVELGYQLSGVTAGGTEPTVQEGASIVRTDGGSGDFGFFQYRWFDVPGDADSDGKIDGQDLATWQENYDPLGLNENTFDMADWDGSGRIDGIDLAIWQDNYNPFGLAATPEVIDFPVGGGGAHTPEPLTILGLVVGLGSLGAYIRRRRMM